MPKRCYILGAGFSKPFGLPLARELTEAVIGRITSNNSVAPAGPLGWALAQWISFMRKLYPRCDFSSACCDFEDAWPDFEDLITILDEWEDYRHDVQGTPTPPGSMQPAHMKRVLLRHLALLFCEKTPANGDEELEPVLRFVRRCAGNNSPVISFNWDVLLEAAAEDENVCCSYGEEPKNAGLLLAKPHGSINQADIASDLHKGLVSQRKVLHDYDDRVVLCANNPREVKDEIVDPFGVEKKPGPQDSGGVLLVAPTAKKSYEHPWLIKQWARALDFILSAEEIVVIGFSLPPTDYRPRVLLQLAGFDGNTKARRLTLVGPHACDVAKHYRKFISLPIKCCTSDWREWMTDEG